MSLGQEGREGGRHALPLLLHSNNAVRVRSIGYKAPSKFHLFVKALFFAVRISAERARVRPLVISCRQRSSTCLPTPRTGTIKFWQFNFGAGCTVCIRRGFEDRVCLRIILCLAVVQQETSRYSPKWNGVHSFVVEKVLDKNSRKSFKPATVHNKPRSRYI